MDANANTAVEKRPQGRPPLPIDQKRWPLRIFPRIALIRRFEEAGEKMGYTSEQLVSIFGPQVLERGLDALEHDQITDFPNDGTNQDHAVTYATISE